MAKTELHGTDAFGFLGTHPHSPVLEGGREEWIAVVTAFREELARAVFGDLGRVLCPAELGHAAGWHGRGRATFVGAHCFENWSAGELAELPAELLRIGVSQISCVITQDGRYGGSRDRAFYEHHLARAGFRLMSEMTPVLRKIPAPVLWDAEAGKALWGMSHLHWNEVPGQLFFIRD